MKILLLINPLRDHELFIRALAKISEPQELQIVHSLEEGENFITREITGRQKHLDIVITDRFEDMPYDASDFCYSIRHSQASFSSNNFKWSSIPLILLTDERLDRERYISFGFDDVVTSAFRPFYNTLPYIAKTKVKEWRNVVFDDLDILDLGPTQDFKRVNIHAVKRRTERTKILTAEFLKRKKSLVINWLNPHLEKMEKGINELERRIKKSETTNRKNEKSFHKVFNRYEELLLRGAFQPKYLYEPIIQPTTCHMNGIKPDFILKNYFSEGDELELLEFKTPNTLLFETSNFHPTLRKTAFKHIGQVKDYKDYLQDPENEKHLEQVLGLKPLKVRYNLVVGRQAELDANEEIYRIRAQQFNLGDINLLSFDSLLDQTRQYHEELSEVGVWS